MKYHWNTIPFGQNLSTLKLGLRKLQEKYQKRTSTRWFKPWPFHPLVGDHLTFPKGHVFTIPRRSQRTARYLMMIFLIVCISPSLEKTHNPVCFYDWLQTIYFTHNILVWFGMSRFQSDVLLMHSAKSGHTKCSCSKHDNQIQYPRGSMYGIFIPTFTIDFSQIYRHIMAYLNTIHGPFGY